MYSYRKTLKNFGVPYTYNPLPARTIRLIQLWQGSGLWEVREPHLICSLTEVPLDDKNLNFNALSYVWGSEIPQSTLWLDGIYDKHLSIRPNLATALHQLRRNKISCCNLVCACREDLLPGEVDVECMRWVYPNYLWIDAICIDQSSNTERAQQVALMHEIYTKASSVIAWLGEEDEYTVPALRLIYGLSSQWDEERDVAFDACRHLAHNYDLKSFWVALGHLFARPWWERIWIVQEFVLGQDIVFVCGRWGIWWEQMSKATTILLSDQTDLLEDATAITGDYRYFHPVKVGISTLKMIKNLRLHNKRDRFYDRYQLNLPPQSEWKLPECTLGALLSITARHKSSDPKDKVYGILGILQDFGIPPEINVHYDWTICDLYMRTAERLWKEDQTLDFLGRLDTRSSLHHKQRFDLPSWTPDFTMPSSHWSQFYCMQDREETPLGHPSMFEFAGSTVVASCEFDFHAKTITVTGFQIEEIGRIEDRINDIVPNFTAEGIPRFCKRICWDQPDQELESKLERFWRAVLGPEPAQASTWANAVADAMPLRHVHTKCFQAAKHKGVGLTDAAVGVGDVVCGVFGFRVPVILRKGSDSWRFVGFW